jgi:23S rRNA pseudouridine1911/1915/1917 synthase
MTRQFENRLVRKTYLCLAHGRANFESRTIQAPLGTDPSDRHRVAVDGLDARSAETRYVKLGESPDGQFSLLRAYPHTGRTHQIRVHAAALGLPLAGDLAYGGLKEHPAYGGRVARVCLHAESLAFNHPTTGEPQLMRASAPPDLREMVAAVGIDPNLLGQEIVPEDSPLVPHP